MSQWVRWKTKNRVCRETGAEPAGALAASRSLEQRCREALHEAAGVAAPGGAPGELASLLAWAEDEMVEALRCLGSASEADAEVELGHLLAEFQQRCAERVLPPPGASAS